MLPSHSVCVAERIAATAAALSSQAHSETRGQRLNAAKFTFTWTCQILSFTQDSARTHSVVSGRRQICSAYLGRIDKQTQIPASRFQSVNGWRLVGVMTSAWGSQQKKHGCSNTAEHRRYQVMQSWQNSYSTKLLWRPWSILSKWTTGLSWTLTLFCAELWLFCPGWSVIT